MTDAANALRDGDPLVVYGTIRLVERDDEAVLDVGARTVGLHHLQPSHPARRGGTGELG